MTAVTAGLVLPAMRLLAAAVLVVFLLRNRQRLAFARRQAGAQGQ